MTYAGVNAHLFEKLSQAPFIGMFNHEILEGASLWRIFRRVSDCRIPFYKERDHVLKVGHDTHDLPFENTACRSHP